MCQIGDQALQILILIYNNLMGNNSNSLGGLQTRYQQLGIDQNQLLSTLILVKDNETHEKLFVKQMNIASDVQYLKLIKEFKQRKAISDKKIGKYLVRVRDFQSKEMSEICGKSFKLLLYIEYLPNSLKTIFQQRLRSKRYFEEDELLRIVRSIVSGLIVLHDNNFKNVHLHKQAIVITSQNTYKLIDTQLCNRIHPYFQILNGVPPKNGTYLAPELLADIKKGSGDYYHSPKVDLFTLGVLLIELATLNNCDRFYDYQSKNVDVNGLRQLASQLQLSQQFRQLLLCLIQEEEQDRIGLLSLRQMVSNQTETLPNQDLFARQSSQLSHPIKQTARTGISKSKRINSVQVASAQTTKDNNQRIIQPPRAYRQISEYINNIQTRENASNVSQVSKRSYQSLQPVYAPIQVQQVPIKPPIQNQVQIQPVPPHVVRITVSNTQSITQPTIQANTQPMLPPVRSTPKAQSLSNHNFPPQPTKQFDTPVNLLIQNQYSPEVNPLPKHQEAEIDQNNKLIQPKRIQPQPGVQIIKTDIFNNKSYGKLDFSNGALYEGEFNQQGQFDGNGMLYYPSGKVCYSGSWKSNAFHGFGVLHNESPEESEEQTPYWSFNLSSLSWSYYEGEFNMDHKQGFGTLYMTNGDKFSGCFKNDSIEGFGTFFIAKEQKHINGIWANNVLKH